MALQPPDPENKKIDITSTSIEKSIEIARDFADKLIMPAAEELGLLVRESVSFWRFKNQIRILTKAKEYCEFNNINPQQISPKLLLPLLEGAALEDDEVLQDKWAILLSNLVDSEQNIQNHVFPYILGQISSNEFLVLEKVFGSWHTRTNDLKSELELHKAGFSEVEAALLRKIAAIKSQLEEELENTEGDKYSDKYLELYGLARNMETKLRQHRFKEKQLTRQMGRPEVVPEENLQEFEITNVTRLGLIRYVQETYADPQTVDLPDLDSYSGAGESIDIDIQLSSTEQYILTELGILFVKACTEKQTP